MYITPILSDTMLNVVLIGNHYCKGRVCQIKTLLNSFSGQGRANKTNGGS
jgi:hypothetical protein